MNAQDDKKIKYIPLNTSESAVLPSPNTLLPQEEVYEPLSKMIEQAVEKAKSVNNKSLNELREHNAISIDGARGTGKTAVLLNLKAYLSSKEFSKDIHVLEPVDPTLLENSESLFLHIIVAAVLHDKEVKERQKTSPDLMRNLNQKLELLAQSLESVETQKERHGIDKVRAMYSNKQLADCVHEFFRATLQLIEKKLLVLPIDDVDTALNRAFENLEIVRRYLTTPFVLPIVSGDRSLYDEVTWRDFHGRLNKDSSYLTEESFKTSKNLAGEYQRKVLPYPRRLTMPPVKRYWLHNDIYLEKNNTPVMPLRNFIAWLDIFLSGPVNGLEDSRLSIPVPSIRALSQLINHSQDIIIALPEYIKNAQSTIEVHRNWQMPDLPNNAISYFQVKYMECYENPRLNDGKLRRNYDSAYQEFSRTAGMNYTGTKTNYNQYRDIAYKLANYFRFEPTAGAAFLVLLAKQHWLSFHTKENRNLGVFDTYIFQPLTHIQKEFSDFDKAHSLSEWKNAFSGRLPEEWLASMAVQYTILPYPLADAGSIASSQWKYKDIINNVKNDKISSEDRNYAIYFINLLAHKSFYTNSKQTMVLNIGRIFELIILSISNSFSMGDLTGILNRAPFFSTSALAPTKTLQVDTTESPTTRVAESPDDGLVQDDAEDFSIGLTSKIYEDIKRWRENNTIQNLDLSPWLVYKVFNKVFSQIAINESDSRNTRSVDDALIIVARVFYATWSAFSSFEKGAIFGLPSLVSNININTSELKKFTSNDLFNTNIRPFGVDNTGDEHRINYGKCTKSVTYLLATHPLRGIIERLLSVNWKDVKTEKDRLMGPKSEIFELLSIPNNSRLTAKLIAEKIADKRESECQNILYDIKVKYPSPNKNDAKAIDYLEKAILQVFTGDR